MKFLITGGCGFVGSNVAATVLQRGDEATVFDDLSRHGSAENLSWLRHQGPVRFIHGDSRNPSDMALAVRETKPDAVLHLAGQVAMTTSMQNPRRDFETNVSGSFNLLEAVREYSPETVIVYSSSNKVYGELRNMELVEEKLRYSSPTHPRGVDESAPIDCQTPYGCSKGAADSYMLEYARGYGLKTVVFRHSTIFGGRQFATFDQGWVGWFCQQAVEIKRSRDRKPFTISGDGKQVRDLLFVEDCVACYLAAIENISEAAGQAFNIGGGIENSSSLLELFEFLNADLAITMRYARLPWRKSDQKFFVANLAKAQRLLHWKPRVGKQEGIRRMIEWVSRAGE